MCMMHNEEGNEAFIRDKQHWQGSGFSQEDMIVTPKDASVLVECVNRAMLKAMDRKVCVVYVCVYGLCVCVYVCMYVCVCVCLYVDRVMLMAIDRKVCVYVCIYVCMYVCVCV